jgi:hypothetical protein
MGTWAAARLGDEAHALKSAASEASTLTTILAEKGFPDVSIPLALWDYLLLNTVGLSEWGIPNHVPKGERT